jgi:transposase
MAKIEDLPRLKKKELRFVFKGNKDAQKRYWVARLVADGYTHRKAAMECNTCPSYVNKWVKRFEETEDLNCFNGDRRGPRGPMKLMGAVLNKVIKAKLENPDSGGDGIYKIISKDVGISLRSTYRILRRFKMGDYRDLLVNNNGFDLSPVRDYYTGYGGSFLLGYYYDKFKILSLFESLGLDTRTSRLLLYYSHGKLMGMGNIHNMYHIGDDGLFFSNGLSEQPHQSTVHNALGLLGDHFIEFQLKLMKRLQNGYLLNLERISLDPHFVSYFGTKKKVAKNWDAIRRYLHPGYRPLYAYDLDAGCCFYALWINEHYKGYRRLSEIIGHINKGLVKGRRVKEVYFDREFYCFDDLRELVEKSHINFTIPARNSQKMCSWLSRIDGRHRGIYKNSRGVKIGVALLEIPPGEWIDKYPYPLTFIGFKEYKDSGGTEYGYLSSIPLEMYRPSVFGKLAKSRWRQENYFKETKHQQGHDDFPSNEDNQMKGHLALEMLGYSVIQLLKRDLPPESKLKRAEIKTFRTKLFQKIARVSEGETRILVDFVKYFLEQRNIAPIFDKYGRDSLSLFDGKRLIFNLKD